MSGVRARRARAEERGQAAAAGPPPQSASDPDASPWGFAALCAPPAFAYLVPPALAAALASLVTVSGGGPFARPGANLMLAGGILLVGLAAGAWAGAAASATERGALARGYEERLGQLDHDLRGPLTIIRGEVELVLSQEDVPMAERGRSTAAIVGQLERLEGRLREEYRP
jgi:signal transduction histidine kinase